MYNAYVHTDFAFLTGKSVVESKFVPETAGPVLQPRFGYGYQEVIKYMKKTILFAVALTLVIGLTACQSSNIQVGGTETDGSANVVVNPFVGTTAETTKRETQAYSIPEGATGPADVTLAGDPYADYPEDKKPDLSKKQVQVRYYYVNSKGLNEEFDVIEDDECNAENLNGLMITMGVLVDDTEVVKFESDGTNGVLTLNKLEGESSHATEQLLAQAIANTFTDNLGLDSLTIKVGDKTYGPLEYTKP